MKFICKLQLYTGTVLVGDICAVLVFLFWEREAHIVYASGLGHQHLSWRAGLWAGRQADRWVGRYRQVRQYIVGHLVLPRLLLLQSV